MKIYLACPVRGIAEEYREGIEAQVKHLEDLGHEVHYPARDTKQCVSSWDVCIQNKMGIRNADIVFVIWDGKSQGVLFDMGMAFAMRKKVRVVTGYMPSMSNEKSFQNLFYEWEEDD